MREDGAERGAWHTAPAKPALLISYDELDSVAAALDRIGRGH